MKKALVFEARREGYGIDQLNSPMTVGELRRLLEDYDDDTLFVLSHDRGYTYGSIEEWNMTMKQETEDGEWEDAEW